MPQKQRKGGKNMSKISMIAELIVKQKINTKCHGCGRAIQVTINDDCYVYLPTGAVRFRCPHCPQEFEIDLDIKEVENKRGK